jgi:hypothetical protein
LNGQAARDPVRHEVRNDFMSSALGAPEIDVDPGADHPVGAATIPRSGDVH